MEEAFTPDFRGVIPERCQDCILAKVAIVNARGRIACQGLIEKHAVEADFSNLFSDCPGNPDVSGQFCSTQKRNCRSPKSREAFLDWRPSNI